ncbi:SDR family oxidoreductase [Mycobacterium spongiae]|uniref:SDR family oxidoreductase n=1 Tax=Mycobacterium spongiae TaxID=886343 RepID=UPI001BA75649|nr:SDR family oxidoreductase [Mycobacterium spongiae]
MVLAGGTGYLGSHIAHELARRGHWCRLICRDPAVARQRAIPANEVVQAQVTDPATLAGVCEGADAVISSVGITRQRDGLAYRDVDYRANRNLLDAARNAGLRSFVYVSVLDGDRLRFLRGCDAKEQFVDDLARSPISGCVVRPTGFYSDMTAFLTMARRGRVWLFGDGQARINPIHGSDLAEVCVDALNRPGDVIAVGGPDVLTYNEIAALAFAALDSQPVVTHLPDIIRRAAPWVLRRTTPQTIYGPVEFLLTVLGRDMVAPRHGNCHLADHYHALAGTALQGG